MVWAPNEGAGYQFGGNAFSAVVGSREAAALDTDGDGELTRADDPYAPYWPGEDAVDWVGMSLYFWGLEYPWGENELAPEGRFAALLEWEKHEPEVDAVIDWRMAGDELLGRALLGSVPADWLLFAEDR